MSRLPCLAGFLTPALVAALPSRSAAAEPPPPGPPWVRELAPAQRAALDKGTPIFIYFTKKSCPHCAPVEKNLLPGDALKPAYDKLTWLYVNRNFDNSPLDRLAEKLELRFGVSSYPHLLLVDPGTLAVVAEVGRTDKAFLAAVQNARVPRPADPKAAAEKLRLAEDRLAKFEANPTAAAAKKHLADEDVVVRYRALEVLAKSEPKAVAAKAGELLKVPHDQFRYEVCEVLARLGDRSAAPALEALVKEPKDSRNPNVVRIRAVEALAACGGEGSVPVIAPFAAGEVNNGLTGKAVDALAAIAARLPKAKPAVKAALVQAYPAPSSSVLGSDAGAVERAKAMAVEQAKKVHLALTQVTGRNVPFPPAYDDAARGKLMKSW